jgi:hypothetical protein
MTAILARSAIADQATFSLDDEDDEDDPDDDAALSLVLELAGLSEGALVPDEDSLEGLSLAAVDELEPFLLSVR